MSLLNIRLMISINHSLTKLIWSFLLNICLSLRQGIHLNRGLNICLILIFFCRKLHIDLAVLFLFSTFLNSLWVLIFCVDLILIFRLQDLFILFLLNLFISWFNLLLIIPFLSLKLLIKFNYCFLFKNFIVNSKILIILLQNFLFFLTKLYFNSLSFCDQIIIFVLNLLFVSFKFFNHFFE